MPVRKSRKTEDRIVELNEKVSDCDAVLRGLKDNHSWNIVLRDLNASKQKIDDSWHSIFDNAKLDELRITKLAVSYLLNLLQTYESDKYNAEQELFKIQNPNSVVNKYYDTEGITEEGNEDE